MKQMFKVTYKKSIPWIQTHAASQAALAVKNPPAKIGDRRDMVLSLGWEDPLEESMETHSNILAGRIPWTEESGGLQSMGSQRIGHD